MVTKFDNNDSSSVIIAINSLAGKKIFGFFGNMSIKIKIKNIVSIYCCS